MPGGKSSSSSSLGRAIIKSRENQPTARKSKKANEESGAGGYVSEKKSNKTVKSVVEENDLDEFLAKADLAGTNFEAERHNVQFISVDDNKLVGAVSAEKTRTIEEIHERLKERLRIPRRPKWTADMSADELQTSEAGSFLEWRRELASLEEEEHILLTPFERNLEVWRQLWRVVERSDVVVQIVDARNPLLFRCRDLETYVKEIGVNKVNFLLINKSDLLTAKQRRAWARYFRQEEIPVAFWSAATADEETGKADDQASSEDGKLEKKSMQEPSEEKESESDTDGSVEDDDSGDEEARTLGDGEDNAPGYYSDGRIVSRPALFHLLKSLRPEKDPSETLTIGMVGYPNVGKSSTINKLIGEKKVAVSATPGKTKHFQTLLIEDKLCLCDCPGLVMPSFVMSKEQMTISGILPSDEMRDHTLAVGLICSYVSRRTFERTYGILLPKPGEYDDPDRNPTPHELLTAYAFVRGYMSSKGIPDGSRAARVIIKDYINGRLRYCHAPPNIDQNTFDDDGDKQEMAGPNRAHQNETLAVLQRRHLLDDKPKTTDVDRAFFGPPAGTARVKSAKKATSAGLGSKRHNNRNKKEKLRRVFSHLDV